jgi:hypothetical protein
MERATRALYAMAVILLLLGLGLRVVPAPVGPAGPGPTRSAASAVPVRETTAELPGARVAIIEGNLFSPSRSAPRVRFTPPDLAPPADGPAPKRRAQPPRLRLFGTVLGPSGPAALIDADPAVRGAEIYQVGDTVDGRRIVAVSESTVVLEGAAGRLVLRLQPARQPTP